MAKNTENNFAAGRKLVRVLAPLSRDEQDLVISVNGVNFTMPQDGRYHEIPEEYAYEYERAKRAERKFQDLQTKLISESQFAE